MTRNSIINIISELGSRKYHQEGVLRTTGRIIWIDSKLEWWKYLSLPHSSAAAIIAADDLFLNKILIGNNRE